MENLREKGKLPPSPDSSPEAFVIKSPPTSHSVGSLRACIDGRAAPAAGTEDNIHRRTHPIVKKGRLPPSSDSSPGAFAIESLPTSHGMGSLRTRINDGAVPPKGTEGNIHRRTHPIVKKGRLPPSSDSSPGAFPIESPPTSHGAGSLRARINEEAAPIAGTEGNTHRRTHPIVKKGRLPPSSDSSPGAFPIESRPTSHSAGSLHASSTKRGYQPSEQKVTFTVEVTLS